MKQLIKKAKQISILILAISLIGCKNDDAELPNVIAGFTYTLNIDTGTVTFINISESSRTYLWDFGDETNSTEINPIKTYTPGEYTVTLKATNVAGASDTFEAIIIISDVGAPVITLLGDTTINMMVGGDPYIDPGATATDNVDGDITANIVVVGVDAVDVNTAATYTITYNVSDAAGNAATQRTRTVIVAADTVAPVITLTGSATINMMVGDTFTDEGATATDDVDGDITANIVVAGNTVDVNTEGTYVITYNVSDAAGNAAAEVTRTVIVAAVPSAGDYLYATSATVTIPSTIINWDSGTVIVDNYSGDATYNPCIQATKIGAGWGTAVVFTDLEVGILSNYSNLEFKIKTTDFTTIKVKVPEVEVPFQIADGTPLADGWVQMSIPLSNFSGVVAAANTFAILEQADGIMLITDVILSGDGGGPPPPSNCPAPPAGELLSNGDFEAGDVGCWQFFAGTSISTTVSNGGSNSAEMQGATGAAVGLKQERFAAGILLPNTQYTVSFDIIADGPFGEGGVFKAFTFSESAEGSDLGAIQHILADGVTSLSTSWETKTYTFTSSADANFVAGGLSFLIEIVNSSVKLNIDNVSITLN